MLTKTQEQILAFLLSYPEEQLAIRAIAKRLRKSYTLVYNNISDLKKKGIITKQNVPPAQIIKLNEFAPIHVFVKIELERKNLFLEKYPWIKVMLEDILRYTRNPFFILMIFGSYAKSTHSKNSDIDLLVIVPEKKNIKDIESSINRTYTKVKRSLNFVDITDFKEMIKNTEELNIGNEAKKKHILLHGTEIYYQLLKEVYKR